MILGKAIGPSEVRHGYDIIDVGEISGNGNTIIRAGHASGNGRDGTWQQSLHIVLTPAEREQLITVLTGQRRHQDVMRSERNAARKQWPAPEENSNDADAIRVWVMHGDYSQTDDPWYSLIVEWESERSHARNG